MSEINEFWPTRHDDKEERLLIIEDCLSALYIRLRKNKPSTKDFTLEIALTNKDLSGIPTQALKDAFRITCDKHEARSMPSNKQILDYWKSTKSYLAKEIKVPCDECDGFGRLSAIEMSTGYRYSFRCGCVNGEKFIKNFVGWGDGHEGFTRDLFYKKPTEELKI